jgi:hypothetical protein
MLTNPLFTGVQPVFRLAAPLLMLMQDPNSLSALSTSRIGKGWCVVQLQYLFQYVSIGGFLLSPVVTGCGKSILAALLQLLEPLPQQI